MSSGRDCAAWATLSALAPELQARSTQSLFDADSERFRHQSCEAHGLLMDYSRQRVDERVLEAFAALAGQLNLRARMEAMFNGEHINRTEDRAVLHTALRRPATGAAGIVAVDALVLAERARVLEFAEGVRSGAIRGSNGAPFERVVNIGIGGSDLGPAMAVEALRAYSAGAPRLCFVSNVDGNQLADALVDADPYRTLFIICSKTFTTQETRANADSARAWLQARLGDAAVPHHFAAVSVNAKAMDSFGVHPDYRFAMWDWVGGRYSVWSSIGVSVAIAVGRGHFEAFLAGAYAMDQHFRSAPWRENLPVLAGMLGVWNVNFLGLPTLAVLPYDQRLARFPAYLQQLEMESNGKSARMDGSPVGLATCPVVWGEPGNSAQHSFFQLLHQGTLLAAMDFLLPVQSSCGNRLQQQLAIANCLAQADAFAFGQANADNLHRHYAGKRPSTLLMFKRLDPFTLGALIALYEHKVFVQSVVWGVNAFDQWGVELGKKLCEGIVPLVRAAASADGEPAVAKPSASLVGALEFVRRMRN
jgi:glucose-6-phosphate isomerase